MSTQVDRARLLDRDKTASVPDKSSWTELQHIQYLIGIWDGVIGSPVRHRELPEWTWVPNDEWQSLRGILGGDSERSTTQIEAEERAWELAHDERKFGPFPTR